MKNYQICECLTCEQARDKAIIFAASAVNDDGLCPISLLAVGQAISAMANELMTHHTLSVVWKDNPRFDGNFFALATHRTEALRSAVEDDVQPMLAQLPADETFIRAAASFRPNGVDFPLDEYITEMGKAAKSMEKDKKKKNGLTDLLSKLLGPGFSVSRVRKPD